MVLALLEANPDKEFIAIAKYVQFFINRAGKNLMPLHRKEIEKAKWILWDLHRGRMSREVCMLLAREGKLPQAVRPDK